MDKVTSSDKQLFHLKRETQFILEEETQFKIEFLHKIDNMGLEGEGVIKQYSKVFLNLNHLYVIEVDLQSMMLNSVC